MASGNSGARSQQVDAVEGDPKGTLGPTRAMRMEYREEYSGEFPHPAHIEHYNDVVPGSGQLIFDMFRDQSRHRREVEKERVAGSERRANRGQILGFVLIFLIIVLGFVAVLVGQAVAGCTMVGLALSTGVLVYVFGQKPTPKS